MTSPTTYQAWRRTTGAAPLTLEKVTESIPTDLKPEEVLIKIHAVSLNYRDVAMLHGKYPATAIDHGVPASDCAAEVVRVGSAVTSFKVGDRVAPIYDLDDITGTEATTRTLGGDVEGVLREYAVFEQNLLYFLPKHLSWEEASSITCAGVTAWDALNMPHTENSGKVVVLQGTGGVSMFGLIISLHGGMHPIVMSSSDEKLSAIMKMSANGREIKTINYRTTPKWEDEVMRITDGKGADLVVETVGLSTMAQSLASLGRRGQVSLVGFLGGLSAGQYPDTVIPVLMKSATLRGIAIGNKTQHQELSDFITKKKISLGPILDKTFAFDDAVAAFDYLYSGKHSGKVVIRL